MRSRLRTPACLLGALLAALVLASGGAPDAIAQSTPAGPTPLAQAAKHDRSAVRHERLGRRYAGRARKAAKAARRRTGAARRRLRRTVRRHRTRAAYHRRRARWHRREAARLRRLAARASAVPPPAPPPPPPPRRAPVPLGSAVFWSEFQADARLPDTFLRHFDQMTAENEMKMYALQPNPGEFDFKVADEMVAWARANGKRIRGHTLVYGSQLPWWVLETSWTREELLQVMEDHIKTVVAHFRGKVAEWDVVNEAIGGDGGWIPNLWYQVIGPDYVEHAFRFARAADPNVRLFYNDAGIDLPDHPHTQGVRSMLSDLKRRGVPVDAVGMQNHMTNRYYADEAQVAETMRRFTALDLDVAVTEMDVKADTGGSREAEFEKQRQIFAGSAKACRLEPRCTSFTTWGISDAYSWHGAEWMPLMFDDGFRAKPAFAAVEDWIKGP